MSLRNFLLGVLNRSISAAGYRTIGCAPDEAFFLADMEVNSRNTPRRSRQVSDEEIKKRIGESRRGYDAAMATLAEGAEKARQEALRFREEVRKKNS